METAPTKQTTAIDDVSSSSIPTTPVAAVSTGKRNEPIEKNVITTIMDEEEKQDRIQRQRQQYESERQAYQSSKQISANTENHPPNKNGSWVDEITDWFRTYYYGDKIRNLLLFPSSGDETSSSSLLWFWGYGFVIVLVSLYSPLGRWMWIQILSFCKIILGTALGIGWGLGLAMHVYDHFERWEQRQQDGDWNANTTMEQPYPNNNKQIRSRSYSGTASGTRGSSALLLQQQQQQESTTKMMMNHVLEDEQTYESLMMSAGYLLSKKKKNHHRTNDKNKHGNLLSGGLLRGQVIVRNHPNDEEEEEDPYQYINTKEESGQRQRQLGFLRAQSSLQQFFPTLPQSVRDILGTCIEYIIRDFVAMWYYKADPGCIYADLENDNHTTTTTASSSSVPPNNNDQHNNNQKYPRRMMYTLATQRPIPFLDALYDSLAIVFGNLATRAEHVNVLELVLLRWVRVLAHTFKWYRTLRKNVQTRILAHERNTRNAIDTNHSTSTTTNVLQRSSQRLSILTKNAASGSSTTNTHAKENVVTGSNIKTKDDVATLKKIPVTEMAMTKEFLFAGKLHRAVTFGLDVPSFLFADANGMECGCPPPSKDTMARMSVEPPAATTSQPPESDDDHPNIPSTSTFSNLHRLTLEDKILEARLYETNLLTECETDYNRVIGYRMVRALVPRSEFGSNIVSTLLTEIMGGCVLTPIMSIFTPEYLNSWIIAGLSSSSENENLPDENKNDSNAVQNDDAKNPSTEIRTDSNASLKKNNTRGRLDADNNNNNKATTPVKSDSQISNIAPPDPQKSVVVTAAEIAQDRHARSYGTPAKNSIQATSSQPSQTNATSTKISFEPSVATTTATSSTPVEKSINYSSSQKYIATRDSALSTGESIVSLLAMALMELQRHVDLEHLRLQGENAENKDGVSSIDRHALETTQADVPVDWDSAECRAAILRLVLVIEAALTNGRCTYKHRNVGSTGDSDDEDNHGPLEESDMDIGAEESEKPVEVTLPEYESTTLTQILMELTSDIEAFEQKVAMENILMLQQGNNKYDDMIPDPYTPNSTEQSTLRTLIAAWLHTGQIFRTISVLMQAHATILAPYYHKTAFLRNQVDASGFIRQLKVLEGVGIMVDTMTVLASPRLEELNMDELYGQPKRSANTKEGKTETATRQEQSQTSSTMLLATSSVLAPQFSSTSATPRYLDFHRNESFAASLRSERERRLASWDRMVDGDSSEGLPVVHHRGSAEVNAAHKELHHIARIFYAGTNMIALRDAARRVSGDAGEATDSTTSTEISEEQVSLMTIETTCPRRRIEVPDDDSSFLLRAQPRPLNAVGVHRDQRNHDQSFKCFAATFEEPALNATSEHYTGGKFIRRCLIRYYPIDRTASVALQYDARKLDQRKSTNSVPETITLSQSSRSAPFLSAEFLKERHLCQRWIPKGTTRSQSILSSSVMEPTDFTSIPRTGKAIDFVYRMNFFERPMLDLGGKHFTVQDSSSLGAHRADASALELSDASLSAALLLLGIDEDREERQKGIEMGKDGYPVVWMKFSRKQDDSHVEVKPYRTSFIRAALMITAARQEAQLRCLIKCVTSGSAKNATKALTDSYLKRTLRLIEYAGSGHEKESLLLRDLKLGVNHIDQAQLRRNALLSPRYPTELIELSATIEDVIQATDVKVVDIFSESSNVFKIKCVAVVALVASDEDLANDTCYRLENGKFARTYREEWFIHRSMKELQSLHKHLKLQVSVTESSGTAGSRLVGAATAAFASTAASQSRTRQRKMLIPSLSQASKAGALGLTRNLVLKRREIVNGYLGYLLSPGHLLSRCSELLLFLGALYPLDLAIRVGTTIHGNKDPLGRTFMTRSVLQLREEMPLDKETNIPSVPTKIRSTRTVSVSSSAISVDSDDDEVIDDDEEDLTRPGKSIFMIPAIKSKIDRVPLSQVRKCAFELLRYIFGFENASFIRNRMLQALKTASFAVTSASEFKKTLYKLHTERINSEAVSGWISMLCDLLWPEGVFFESKPPTSLAELRRQADEAKQCLHSNFPEQVRAILGQELTKDGMDIFHEMLQNRMVVKSMAYMLFDLLWIEIFPEIGDVLQCGEALDIDKNK